MDTADCSSTNLIAIASRMPASVNRRRCCNAPVKKTGEEQTLVVNASDKALPSDNCKSTTLSPKVSGHRVLGH